MRKAHRMNWRRRGRWLLVVAAILLLACLGASWYVAGRLVAPANRPVGLPPDMMPIETISIPSQSGSLLSGWHIPAEDATATVILLHPIRADRRAMLGRAKLLHDAGYATVLVDLQAHGESPGDYITIGYLERHDVAAAVDFVRRRHPDHKIGIVGCSLGGAATLLASPLPIDALVLESVYPTINEAVHNRVSKRLGPLHHLLAPTLLVQLRPRLGISPADLRPIDHMDEVGCPVLIAAGDRDVHTTLAESTRMYDAAHQPKQFVLFQGAAHTDLLRYDPDTYRNEIVGFLDVHLRPLE